MEIFFTILIMTLVVSLSGVVTRVLPFQVPLPLIQIAIGALLAWPLIPDLRVGGEERGELAVDACLRGDGTFEAASMREAEGDDAQRLVRALRGVLALPLTTRAGTFAPQGQPHGVPTHSSPPSVKIWCFQIGTRTFRSSISR